MFTRLLQRILLLVPTLLGAVTLVFLVAHVIPGGPARALLGEKATPERLKYVAEKYGWDDPLAVQYGRFLKNTFFRFNFGESYFTGRTVSEEIREYFPATAELALAAMLPAVLIGITLGVLASLRPGGFFDVSCTGFSTVGVSIPVFFLGLLLLLTFRSFPMGGRLDITMDVEPITGLLIPDSILRGQWDAASNAFRHLILPALALSTIPLAIITRMTRSSMLDVLQHDFIRTARAKGIGPNRVILMHALPNAALPIITVIGLQFGYLLAGAVLTESVFDWPGLGTYLTDAVNNRDFNAIQGSTIVIVFCFVLVNLLVDLTYLVFEPRLRKEGTN